MEIWGIGVKLYEILLSAGCDERVFPLVAEKDPDFPFIIYRRMSATMVTTKNLTAGSEYEIAVVSDSYAVAMQIAETAIELLHLRRGDGMYIQLTNIEENFAEGFIINLTFKIDI